jgi:hypothetical protein
MDYNERQKLNSLSKKSLSINWIPSIVKTPENQITKFPLSLLKKIYECLYNKSIDYDKDPWKYEYMISKLIGDDILDWPNILRNKYKKGLLSEEVWKCFMPTLKSTIIELYADIIADAVDKYAALYDDFQWFWWIEQSDTVQFKVKEGKKRFGFILNTQKDTGSHWVCLFIDTKQTFVEFFDSIGFQPNGHLKIVIDSILNILKINFPDLKKTCKFNANTFQTSGLDCGVYITHFLIYRMKNKGTIDDFCETEDLTPNNIIKYKNIYWNFIK